MTHSVIIIIKKVKIIVTLSIKNTAGALYKSDCCSLLTAVPKSGIHSSFNVAVTL